MQNWMRFMRYRTWSFGWTCRHGHSTKPHLIHWSCYRDTKTSYSTIFKNDTLITKPNELRHTITNTYLTAMLSSGESSSLLLFTFGGGGGKSGLCPSCLNMGVFSVTRRSMFAFFSRRYLTCPQVLYWKIFEWFWLTLTLKKVLCPSLFFSHQVTHSVHLEINNALPVYKVCNIDFKRWRFFTDHIDSCVYVLVCYFVAHSQASEYAYNTQ